VGYRPAGAGVLIEGAEMVKKLTGPKSGRAARMKISAKESLKRMEAFDKRRKKFIATIRKGKD
jgi:hypothetical protein